MLDLYKNRFKSLEKRIGKLFSFLPFSPNQYTLLSVVFALFALYFLIRVDLVVAIIFFLISFFLDFIDGAVARFIGKATKLGAYLDTICDRYVEGIVLLGLIFFPLPRVWLPSYIWIFLILFGSLMTTYLKAAAKEKDLVSQELKGGLLSRAERLILISLSMILGIFNLNWMVYILIFIAVLSNFTAFQRIKLAISGKK